MTHVDGLHGGLQRVAEDLKVERIGPMHQAGSDSMLTNATFFRLAELAFSSPEKVEEKYRGAIYGLGEHAYRGKQHQDAAASKYNQDNGGTMNGGHQVQNGVVNMPNDE
jgi:CCR4-NOT transcription complex subunit 7/8